MVPAKVAEAIKRRGPLRVQRGPRVQRASDMRFQKYHASKRLHRSSTRADYPSWAEPDRARIRVICHRNFGVGSDRDSCGPAPLEEADFGLRIFNPDGSEAEKSGNGLRIFSRHL